MGHPWRGVRLALLTLLVNIQFASVNIWTVAHAMTKPDDQIQEFTNGEFQKTSIIILILSNDKDFERLSKFLCNVKFKHEIHPWYPPIPI